MIGTGACLIYQFTRKLFIPGCVTKARAGIRGKIKLLSHSAERRLTVSVKLYIVGAQLDGGVTGRDHKSDQARKGQHMPGIMSNQPCFRQGTHPLLQLSHMLYLRSTINDLISLSLSLKRDGGIFTSTSLQ